MSATDRELPVPFISSQPQPHSQDRTQEMQPYWAESSLGTKFYFEAPNRLVGQPLRTQIAKAHVRLFPQLGDVECHAIATAEGEARPTGYTLPDDFDFSGQPSQRAKSGTDLTWRHPRLAIVTPPPSVWATTMTTHQASARRAACRALHCPPLCPRGADPAAATSWTPGAPPQVLYWLILARTKLSLLPAAGCQGRTRAARKRVPLSHG